ncbi:MAG: hypothetical protein RR315_07605 [Oscillospiraceae bacterium]
MQVLDKISRKAKELVGEASKRTENTVELGKLKLKLSQTETRLKSTYERIGTLVYEESQGYADNSDLTDICIKEVNILVEQKKQLNEKIYNLHAQKICPSCHKENPYDKSYCDACGAKLK